MNFSELKEKLGAEPLNRDPEILEAIESDPEFRAFAEEAEAFEKKLQAAFAIRTPPFLLDQIASIPKVTELTPRPRRTRLAWLAAAAVFVAGVGFASYTWYESTFYWDNIDDFIVEHWAEDGQKLLALADGQADDATAALFARFDVQISSELAGLIDLAHPCKTPGSRGAHMVVTTDTGPVTLIFMPKVDTENGHILDMGEQVAATLPLEKGSAVIIGPSEEAIAPIYAIAREGIRPISATS